MLCTPFVLTWKMPTHTPSGVTLRAVLLEAPKSALGCAMSTTANRQMGTAIRTDLRHTAARELTAAVRIQDYAWLLVRSPCISWSYSCECKALAVQLQKILCTMLLDLQAVHTASHCVQCRTYVAHLEGTSFSSRGASTAIIGGLRN